MRSKENVEEDVELITLVNSKSYWEKLLRKASQDFVKIKEGKLSFLKEGILLDMVSWKSCGEKGRGDPINVLTRSIWENPIY